MLQLILSRHREKPFDAAIHLGDVYFAAGSHEMLTHFLGPFSQLGAAGIPVYTLLGNHDLYYGGSAYEQAISILKQPGRYFAIESPGWQIACLDTALFDDTLQRQNGKLDAKQLKWLDELLSNKDRRTIVLSHHFFISAWKPGGESLRDQLANVLKNRALRHGTGDMNTPAPRTTATRTASMARASATAHSAKCGPGRYRPKPACPVGTPKVAVSALEAMAPTTGSTAFWNCRSGGSPSRRYITWRAVRNRDISAH